MAADEAVADSGLDLSSGAGVDHDRLGVSLGSAVGATMRLEDEYVRVSDAGRYWLVDPSYGIPLPLPGPGTQQRGHRAGHAATTRTGPASVISTGCTSGIDAVGYGTQLIEDGDADVVVAGASDAPISPISIACFDTIRATSARNDDPEHASRPFDATRDGFVMGEGGAVLILEEYEHARARGAPTSTARCAGSPTAATPST